MFVVRVLLSFYLCEPVHYSGSLAGVKGGQFPTFADWRSWLWPSGRTLPVMTLLWAMEFLGSGEDRAFCRTSISLLAA